MFKSTFLIFNLLDNAYGTVRSELNLGDTIFKCDLEVQHSDYATTIIPFTQIQAFNWPPVAFEWQRLATGMSPATDSDTQAAGKGRSGD